MTVIVRLKDKAAFKVFSGKISALEKTENFETSVMHLIEDAHILYSDVAEEVRIDIGSIKHNGIIEKYNFTIVKAKSRYALSKHERKVYLVPLKNGEPDFEKAEEV